MLSTDTMYVAQSMLVHYLTLPLIMPKTGGHWTFLMKNQFNIPTWLLDLAFQIVESAPSL